MNVTFTREARDDLREIADNIASDAPRRALSFVRELRMSARAIGQAPGSYPFDARFEHLAVRRRVHGSYLILYRSLDNRVDILRIVHGARERIRLPDSPT